MAENKRRIYLINPTFQLRFSFYVCLVIFISSIIYPLTIYDLIGHIAVSVANVAPGIIPQLESRKKELIIFLSIWQAGFCCIVFLVCIVISHKIAGPLYKLRKFLQAIRNNNSLGRLSFRDGDYFAEIAEDYNDAIEQIQENYRKDFVYLSEVNAYLSNLSLVVPEDKKVVLNEISRKLTEIQERFTSL